MSTLNRHALDMSVEFLNDALAASRANDRPGFEGQVTWCILKARERILAAIADVEVETVRELVT